MIKARPFSETHQLCFLIIQRNSCCFIKKPHPEAEHAHSTKSQVSAV